MNRWLDRLRHRPWVVVSLLVGPALGWIALFALIPSLTVLADSFMTRSPTGSVTLPFTVANYTRIATKGLYPSIIWQSVLIGLETTLLAVVIGYPVAHYLATRRRRATLLVLLVIIPFWTSYLIRIFAWVLILMERGLLNTMLLGVGVVDRPLSLLYTHVGVVIAILYSALPFVILPIYAVIAGLDDRLTEAALTLGANEWHAFREVTLPLSLPGVLAGATIAFIFSMGSYLGPAILGGKDVAMVAKTIFDFYFQYFDWPFGSALSLVVILVVLALMSLVGRLVRFESLYGRS